MAMPKIEYPMFEIFVQSAGRKVKFRPFLVKEEKILLTAKESNDADEIKLSIKQIINNCLCDKLDVDKLPLFDVEMIFIKLRARSVGETVKLVFNCKQNVEGVICDTETDYALNLDKVTYVIPEGHSSTVMFSDKVGMKLRYPTLSEGLLAETDGDEVQELLRTIINNTECFFDANSVYKPEDLTEEEMINWIEGLTIESLGKIREFFNTSPKVVLEDKVPCKKCGFVHNLYTEELISFFI